MEKDEARLSKGVWWFAVGCVALAAFVVACGIWSALAGILLMLRMQSIGEIGQIQPMLLVVSWWLAATPVAACVAAWWVCLRFAKAAGRPQTEWRGRLALLGVVVGVMAGVMLFNAVFGAGLWTWVARRMPPPQYPYPADLDGSMAAQRRLNVQVGMGSPSASSAVAGAEAAWSATSAYLHPENDEWEAEEWEAEEKAEEPNP